MNNRKYREEREHAGEHAKTSQDVGAPQGTDLGRIEERGDDEDGDERERPEGGADPFDRRTVGRARRPRRSFRVVARRTAHRP